MNWFASGRTGALLEGLNEISHLPHDIHTQDKKCVISVMEIMV
jgi:hypothetical protein